MTVRRNLKKVKPVKPTKSQKKFLWIIFFCVLAITLGLEYFVTPNPHFGIDGSRFFFAWFGLAACLGIIILSKSLGFFLKRPENYYKGDEE